MSRRPNVSPAFLVLDDDPACGPCLCAECVAARPKRAATRAKHTRRLWELFRYGKNTPKAARS